MDTDKTKRAVDQLYRSQAVSETLVRDPYTNTVSEVQLSLSPHHKNSELLHESSCCYLTVHTYSADDSFAISKWPAELAAFM